MAVILFVCTGNTCRSPMTMALAEMQHAKKAINGLANEYISRGINVLIPQRAEKNAIQVLKSEYNIFIDDHIARQLSNEDLIYADLVVTMTKAHKQYLDCAYPDYADKTMTFAEYTKTDVGDIADPFGGDLFEYSRCGLQISNCLLNI